MGTRLNPICACGEPKRDGRCTAVPSCDDFKRPAWRARAVEVAAKRRERDGNAPLLGRREVAAGAAKALAKSTRQVRGGGDATDVSTLEAGLSSGRW